MERWLYSEVLRSRGGPGGPAADAKEAWAAYEAAPFPLVILDLVLPEGDGLDLCRRIRARPGGDDVVVLVVTGKDDPNVMQESLDAGADDFLAKPVDAAVFNLRLAVLEREVVSKQARRRDRDRLASHEEEVVSLLANLDEVIFAVDARAGRLITVSPAATRVLGRAPEDLLTNEALWRSLLFPPELEVRQSELTEDGGRGVTQRWRVRLPSGEIRWVEASIKGAHDAHGDLARIDGVLSDVTESQRSQDELAARNKELMTLYRISEVTLTATSTERAYEEILREVAKATGFAMALIERHDPQHARLVVTAAWGAPSDRIGREMPVQGTLAGAAVRNLQPTVEFGAATRPELVDDVLHGLGIQSYLAFPMTLGHDVVGALVLAHPAPLEPDRRLVRWAGSLANAVAQFLDRVGTQEALRENELRYRRIADELQQANQELERFAYSVSHDLRAPLRTMQGFAHALIQNFADRLPAEARDYAQRIIASGQQAEILIRDLLAYSRLSFEQLELQPIDLERVVAAAREQLDGDLRESQADFSVEGALPQALGQATTLIQVVANLVANAIKFTPVGASPRIRIRAEPREDWVRLWVVDNGIGIPRGQEERIFRVFERLTEVGARPGTGIGLAIVRRGMERLGGNAGVEPAPDGQGSAFWLDIPRVAGPRSGWRRTGN